MIKEWLKQDIERLLQHKATRIVITDAHKEGVFIRDLIPSEYPVIEADGDQAEADAKYKAEHEYQGIPVVFYTHTPKRNLGLLLDYAKTGGCIVLDDIETYIKDHIFHELRVNVQIPKKQLVLAAKLSVDKDKQWWKGICDGTIPPMDIHKEVLNLLLDPQEVYNRMDADTWTLFQEEVFALIGKPFSPQTYNVFTQEVFNAIFTLLLTNKISEELLSIYYDWVDNDQYRQSVARALNLFEIPADVDILHIHPDHCFEDLDKRYFRQLSATIKSGKNIFEYRHFLNSRLSNKHARCYKSAWLNDLKVLLDFQSPTIVADDIDMFINYYRNNFAFLDTAMRHLYAEWLNEETYLRPLQELYENYNKVVQDKWNGFFRKYEPTEYNIVPAFFLEPGRSAVIVCDGLRLEMAIEVVKNVREKARQITIDQNTANAVLPSITENGMSALYGSRFVITSAQKRFDHLRTFTPDAVVKPLDMLSPSETAEHLVLTFGDIDQVCEKKQLAGLKDIAHYGDHLCETIAELLKMGYEHVLLTSDHGYVITGILDDADKIPTPNAPDVKVEERYALSNDTAIEGKYHVLRTSYNDFAAQYYPKSDKPFVTRGAYGYAHGGFTPQECIIPAFIFKQPKAAPALKIRILDKSQLQNIVGSIFKIKVSAEGDMNSLFEQERKVCINLYDSTGQKVLSIIKTLKAGQTEELETTFPGGACRLIVTDATDGQQLDSCEVNQSNQRDLGGL